jgi:hypothetical protein
MCGFGLRPSVDVYGGWRWQEASFEGFSEDNHYGNFGFGLIVPLSPIVGVNSSVFDLTIGGGATHIRLAGLVGLIEMIPGKTVSPYFRQFITLDFITENNIDYTNFGIGANIGTEFMSSSNISPFVEGTFLYATESLESLSADVIGLGVTGGIRIKFQN